MTLKNFMAFIVVLALVAAIRAEQDGEPTLRTRRIEIIDKNNRTKMTLGCADGHPFIELGSGANKLVLKSNDRYGGMTILSAEGDPLIQLVASGNNGPRGLIFYSSNRQKRVELAAANGGAFLALRAAPKDKKLCGVELIADPGMANATAWLGDGKAQLVSSASEGDYVQTEDETGETWKSVQSRKK